MKNCVIYKTALDFLRYERVDSYTTVYLPAGARPLAFRSQRGVPTVWWQVDDANPRVGYKVFIFETGAKFDAEGKTFVGTDLFDSGLVFHCYVSPV